MIQCHLHLRLHLHFYITLTIMCSVHWRRLLFNLPITGVIFIKYYLPKRHADYEKENKNEKRKRKSTLFLKVFGEQSHFTLNKSPQITEFIYLLQSLCACKFIVPWIWFDLIVQESCNQFERVAQCSHSHKFQLHCFMLAVNKMKNTKKKTNVRLYAHLQNRLIYLD